MRRKTPRARACKTLRVLARQGVILPMPRCRRARPRLAGPLREGNCRQGMFAALYDYRVGQAQACSGFGPRGRGGGMSALMFTPWWPNLVPCIDGAQP